MTLWVVHAGKLSQGQSTAIQENCVVAGWDEVGDLSTYKGLNDLKSALRSIYPDDKEKTIINWAGQLLAFRDQIQLGDLVILPLKGQPFFAVGEVSGPYQYNQTGPAGAFHRRQTRWLDTAFQRSRLDKDLLFSIGSALTVSRPRAPEAETRVRAALKGEKIRSAKVDVAAATEDATDYADLARNDIADRIIQKFKGHGLEGLVEDVLRAEGFVTTRSKPGPDGGRDILAGRGPLGLEAPRIVVQVKSQSSPVDASTVRELQGVVSRYGAEYGLFVAWGGFKSSVQVEIQRDHFRIRLWDAGHLIDAVLAHYHQLPEKTRAMIPLRQIWTLAPDEDEV